MSATNQNLTASVSPLVSIELHDINGKQVPPSPAFKWPKRLGRNICMS